MGNRRGDECEAKWGKFRGFWKCKLNQFEIYVGRYLVELE
jgi:hypothetical protein